MIRHIQDIEDFEAVRQESDAMPILLFKHSTTCPVSSAALSEVEGFVENNTNIPVRQITVQSARSLSNHVASELDVIHESPQAILLFKDKVYWHDSHYSITEDMLSRVLQQATQL
jgi:bacillithiol system protein YtxJ